MEELSFGHGDTKKHRLCLYRHSDMKHKSLLGKTGYIRPYIHMAFFIPLLTFGQSKTLTLTWSNPPVNTNVTFEIWEAKTLYPVGFTYVAAPFTNFFLLKTYPTNFQLFATTIQTNFQLTNNHPWGFYAVRSKRYGLYSGWAIATNK
jgi:hypothetical protein